MVRQVVMMVKICHCYMMIRMSALLMFIIIIFVSNLKISEANGKCQQEASCIGLKNTTCLGVTLPYKYTSLGIFAGNHLRDESEIRGFLAQWKAVLQSVPRCWTSLQPFICTLYFPKCDDGQISLPSKEMCKTARNNCKFIENNFGIDSVPPFLNCDQSYMQPNCGYGYKDVKLISPPSKCKYPLTSTEDSNIWYPGFEGCGVQCESPVLSEKDQRDLTTFIKYSVSISSLFLLFSAINFLVDWKSSNKYPPVIIFYSCICLLLHNLGWSLQFWTSKQDIVCRPDNTRRYGEPSTSESFSCLLSFALIYYFSTAAMIWIVILAFLWDSKFGKPNGFKNFVASKEGYFHIIAWSIPFILTITIISIGEVDSSPMLGICYVGLDKVIVRVFVVFIPIVACATCALIYFYRSVIDLKIILHHKNNQARKGNSEINKMIIRIVLFASFIFIAVMCTVLCTIYDFNYFHVWEETLTKRIICSLDLIANIAPAKANECQSKIGINLFYTYLQLFVIFTSGVAVSLWSYTEKSLAAWRRLILKKCDMNPNRPMSGRKHEMVANGYNHRSEIAQGCYSSFVRSIHGDPVDMGLTSATSAEISSEFTRVLPKFLFRRGAVTDLKENNYLQDYTLNNSSTSDLYQPVHPMNFLFNKRASFDSRISNESEIAEIMKHVKRKTRKERRKNFFQGLSGPSYRNNISPGQNFSLPVSHIKNGVNRSTSTTELRDSSNGVPHSIYGVMPPFPFSPPSYPTLANCPFPSVLPVHSSKQPIVLSRKCLKPSNITFTHGMAQNHDKTNPQPLTNPLMEKRRPDSRMNGFHESPPVNVSNNQTNLGVGYSNSINFMPSMSGTHFNPLFNSPMVNPCLGNPMPYLGYPTAAPGAFHPYYGHSVHPFVSGNGKRIQNLDELAEIVKQREEFMPICTAHPEPPTPVDDGPPNIQPSDTEASQSDNGGFNGAFDRNPSELIAAQRLVDERMKRIEGRGKDESDN